MMDRSVFLKSAAAGAALGAAPSAAWAKDGAALVDSVTFQLGWIANVENMGEFVADSKGYYRAQDLDVKLVPGGPAVAVEPLLVAGKALVALSAPDIVAQARL